jgi:hypothetical protein
MKGVCVRFWVPKGGVLRSLSSVACGSGLGSAPNARWPHHYSPTPHSCLRTLPLLTLLKFTWLLARPCCQMCSSVHHSFFILLESLSMAEKLLFFYGFDV